MAYQYTSIDGQRVEVTVAANFRNMAAEFQRVFGLSLHVRSGTRTREEQARLYDGWIRRLPGFYLAAPPGQSFHEESGPQGPRALDLYDSGSDAGASVAGSHRNNWLRDNMHRWGFTLSGLTFSPIEGWHCHFTQALAGQVVGGGSGWPANERYGAEWVKSAQQKLRALGLYSGDIDGQDGPQTQAGAKELQKIGGLDQDGIYGPQTNTVADIILAGQNQTQRSVAEIQRRVGAPIDNIWGPITCLHVYIWQKSQGLVADAIWGPASDAKGFPPAPQEPAKQYPTNGRNITARKTVDIQRALIEKKFLAAGEDDGSYGPKTSVAVAMFQEAEKVTVDGIYGNETDSRLFPGVPLPGRLVATPRQATLPFATEGWTVPYGKSERDAGSIVSTYYIHHEAGLGSDAEYFKSENERGVAPTWEVDGAKVREFMHPAKRPSATGVGNTYSVASETVNTTVAPTWEVEQASLESHAKIAAWLSKQTELVDPDNGKVYKVRINLDRQSIRGHREAPGVEPTACPGPFIWDHMDWIVARAKQIIAAEQPEPEPDPEPDPTLPTLAQLREWADGADALAASIKTFLS